MIKGVGHIGLAARSIEKTVPALCKALNIPEPSIKNVKERQMKVAVISLGNIQLEIIEDYSNDGVLAKKIRKSGPELHHFCLLSDDIETDMAELERRGVAWADKIPKTGLRGKKIAFTTIDLLDGIPIEISEP